MFSYSDRPRKIEGMLLSVSARLGQYKVQQVPSAKEQMFEAKHGVGVVLCMFLFIWHSISLDDELSTC